MLRQSIVDIEAGVESVFLLDDSSFSSLFDILLADDVAGSDFSILLIDDNFEVVLRGEAFLDLHFALDDVS